MASKFRLNQRQEVFRDLHNQAFQLFESGDQERAERLCRRLLTYIDLGDFHKARCHWMLAHGQHNIVFHAELAVHLLENLSAESAGVSPTIKPPPSDEDLRSRDKLLPSAREILEKSKKMTAEVRVEQNHELATIREHHGREPTNDEIFDAWLRKQRDSDLKEDNGEEDGSDRQLVAGAAGGETKGKGPA